MHNDDITRLMASGRYGGIPLAGTLIETHISWVILAGPWAFKIKKPMRYSFLDFSTLAKRRHFCEEEVRLNRRLTGIYKDVLPVKKTARGLTLGGRGRTVGYAVRMKKLQPAKKMDRLLNQGLVTGEHIRLLADKIAAFHRRAPVVSRPFHAKEFKSAFNDILSMEAWAATPQGRGALPLIRDAVALSDRFLDAHRRRLDARIRLGYRRDVHGDLHSRNIFLYRDPVIFDCIEFNAGFRRIDVLNEVAFFCMDLEATGKKRLAKAFMKRYLASFPCMDDAADERLFTYFKMYRANVRAKVNALRAMQAGDTRGAGKHHREVKKYLRLLAGYLRRLR